MQKFQGIKNATKLLGKIYKGEITKKTASYSHYRLIHLPCIKLLYKHPDEIWKDFKDDRYEHYLKYITTAKSKKFTAKTLLVKKTKGGFYVPITCYPVARNYLKKIKSTDLLWTKGGVKQANPDSASPLCCKEDTSESGKLSP